MIRGHNLTSQLVKTTSMLPITLLGQLLVSESNMDINVNDTSSYFAPFCFLDYSIPYIL